MRALRAMFLAAVAAALVAASGPARAERVRVRLRGPGADTIERAVARVFESHGYEVVGGRKKAGLRVSGRVKAPASGKKVSVHLTVRRSSGAVVGRLRVRAGSRPAAVSRVEKQLWARVGPALANGSGRAGAAARDEAPEDEPELTPAAEVEEGDEAEQPVPAERRRSRRARAKRVATREPVDRGEPVQAEAAVEIEVAEPEAGQGPWITLAVGPELYARHFSYRDDIFQALREYDLDATPALGLAAEVYPMAMRSRGVVSGLGVAARFTVVPTIDSEDASGSQYTSEARSYQLGGRYRHRIGFVDLGGALDYGAQSFSIAAVGDAPDPDFPDVDYSYLRAGLGVAARIGERFALSAGFGYRQVLSTGEIESSEFFPRSSARGLDASLELSTALLWGFDVRAGAELERYGYSLSPEPGDARVAGGALDQYMRAFVRLGYSR